MENKKIRIYGNEINTWPNGQVELEYKDIDAKTGKLLQMGSEDFSLERRKKCIRTYRVENMLRDYIFTISTDRNNIDQLWDLVNVNWR